MIEKLSRNYVLNIRVRYNLLATAYGRNNNYAFLYVICYINLNEGMVFTMIIFSILINKFIAILDPKVFLTLNSTLQLILLFLCK